MGDSLHMKPSTIGDSTVNYIDRDLVEVLTMSNSWGTCNCFFTTRELREVLESVPEWGINQLQPIKSGGHHLSVRLLYHHRPSSTI